MTELNLKKALASGAELLPIVKNALPVCVAQGLAATIGLVDVHLAGNLGAAVQAGVGIGDQMLFFAALLGTGIAQGAASLIARHTGAEDRRQAKTLASTGLVLAAILGAVASVFTFLYADFFIALFSQDATARHSGTLYLKLCSIANLPYCLMLTQSAILRAAGKSFSTVFPWFVATTVSVTLSLSLPQTMPDGKLFTIEYIALAWNLGAIVAAIIGHWQLKKLGFELFDADLTADTYMKGARDILLLGMPIAATEAAWLSSNFFMYIILAQLSSANEAQAAWTIRLKVEEILATPAILAINMTAAALVGQLVGAGNWEAAGRTARKAAVAAASLMFCVGLIVFANNESISSFYAPTQASAQCARNLLSASLIVYPLSAFYITGFGALEGAGSTLKPMLAVFAGLFLLRIPLASFLALNLETGINGIVLSIIISHAAVALSAVSQIRRFFGAGEFEGRTAILPGLRSKSRSDNPGTFSLQPVTMSKYCRSSEISSFETPKTLRRLRKAAKNRD